MSVEGIYNCLAHHKIVPESIDQQWDGYWNTESKDYTITHGLAIITEHASVSLYRGRKGFYYTVYSNFLKEILDKSIGLAEKKLPGEYKIEWIHSHMVKIILTGNSVNDEIASGLYHDMNSLFHDSGLVAIN